MDSEDGMEFEELDEVDQFVSSTDTVESEPLIEAVEFEDALKVGDVALSSLSILRGPKVDIDVPDVDVDGPDVDVDGPDVDVDVPDVDVDGQVKSIQFNLTIQKEVLGEMTQPGTFHFGVSQQTYDFEKIDLPENVEITVNDEGSGETSMGPFVITSPGYYNFSIWEADPNRSENADTYIQQNGPHYLYLSVAYDNNNHQLIIEECWIDEFEIQSSSDGTLEVPTLHFSNAVVTEDTESVEATIPVKKITMGEGFPEGQEFHFEIISVDGAPLPEKTVISRTGEGDLEFGPITFYREGYYEYKVKEIAGNHPNIYYDSTEWTVEVGISKNSGDVDVSLPKFFINDLDIDLGIDESTNSSAFNISIYGFITGGYGPYIDLLNENRIEFTNVFYNNSVEAEIPVTKIVELGENAEGKKTEKPEKPETFTFKIEPVGDAPMPENDTITITTNEEGSGSFKISYNIPGEYKYKISEVKGESPHYTYDSKSWIAMVYIDSNYNWDEDTWKMIPTGSFDSPDVRVYPSNQDGTRITDCDYPTVPDPGTTRVANSKVSSVGSDSSESDTSAVALLSVIVPDPGVNCRPVSEDCIVFTNIYNPVETIEINGKKTWNDNNDARGLRPESIKINLLAGDVILKSITVTEADQWEWTFTDLARYKDGKEIKYAIEEEAVENYTAKVDGYNVTNTVQKQVKPNKPSKPEEPENPNEPSEPETPEEPDKPSNPEDPNEPSDPADTDEPNEPVKPNNPENLDTPDKPNKSSNPGKIVTTTSAKSSQSMVSIPKTGDEGHIVMYGILMMMSMLLLAGTILLSKKKLH